ncbi:RNA dependent RNA polymerase-domain-containing protein [Chytriomyces sp. MP71]|nr:RNA dependent RNA polymerase-domain-containing protein [Chytriomyces sp. MP71]
MELVCEVPAYITSRRALERALEHAFAESDELHGTPFKLLKSRNAKWATITVPNEKAGVFLVSAGKWGRIVVGMTELLPRRSKNRPDANTVKSLLNPQPAFAQQTRPAKLDGTRDINTLLGEQLDLAWDDDDDDLSSLTSSNWTTNMPDVADADALLDIETAIPAREIWFGVWVDNEARIPQSGPRVQRHATLLPTAQETGFHTFDLLPPAERGRPTFSPEWKASQIVGMNSYDHPFLEVEGYIFKLKLSADKQIQFFEYNIKSVVLHHNPDESNVYITLVHPPVIADTSEATSLKYADMNKAKLTRLFQVNSKHAYFAFHCLVCRISFSPTRTDAVANIFARVSPSAQSPVIHSKSSVYARKYQDALRNLCTNLPIRIAYQLTVLLTWNIMFPTEIIEFIKTRLMPLVTTKSELEIAQLLNILARSTKWEPFRGEPRPNFPLLFDTIVKRFEYVPEDYDPQKYCTIFRLYVTPTGQYLDGPYLDKSNRVVRHFQSYAAHFLHVSFVEEDGEQISHNDFGDIPHDIIYEDRYCTLLKEGIRVAGRLFKFLAFSNSSLREGRVLFFHEPADGSVTVEKIRAWMGDFSLIKSPARYAARMGQAFTSTASTVDVLPSEVEMHHPDVERNGFNFSDGIGTVSPEIAAEIWEIMKKLDKRLARSLEVGDVICNEVPSAFQIRFGGAKGMVSVDPSLKGRKLIIRKSMIKFDSPNCHTIEIADCSIICRDAYFNRQIILVLEDLGVSKQIFLDIQRDCVRELGTMWNSPEKLLELAGRDGAFGNCVRLWNNLGVVGWMENEFIRSSFEHIRAYLLRQIKYRARMKIPGAWTLFGVLDETGTLKEGQVFVQLSKPTETQVLTGPLIIYRTPVIHPGDVQPCVAVDVPALCHMKNVIVFSQHGKRDLPSKLAGGDLDGDMFTVIQNRKLFPLPSAFRAAAEYPLIKPLEMDHKITMNDITEFVVYFMTNNKLGIIARRHLALADQRVGGSLHPDCLQLAELHSQAVDFPKTGHPADIKAAVSLKNRPDFMSTPDFKFKDGFYKSPRAMGVMYRDTELNSLIEQTYNAGLARKGEKLSETDCMWKFMRAKCEAWEAFVEPAMKFQYTFECELDHIASYCRPKLSEVEFWTGYINQNGRKTRRELFNLEDWARDQFGTLLRKAEKLMTEGRPQKDIIGLAVANYYVSNVVKPNEKCGSVFGFLLFHYLSDS